MQQVDRYLIIAGSMNHSPIAKPKALLEYARRLPAFLSPVGLALLAQGIISLFLSERSRAWLRQKMRKRPASLQSE